MTYADDLKRRFSGLNPVMADLYLLEAHQIASLPTRAPGRELAVSLHANPGLVRFFAVRHPPVAAFLAGLMDEYGPEGVDETGVCEDRVLWELADWIAYQRDPETYDGHSGVDWVLGAVTDLVDIEDKVAIDAGAGTGRVALAVAPHVRCVYAVEPVGTLRAFMRDKAAGLGLTNMFVMDGFLHAMPLPPDSADVLLTSQAIGWDLDAELAEIERVVRSGGHAIHSIGVPGATEFDSPLHEPMLRHGYRPDAYLEAGHDIARYWKRIG